MIGIGVSQLAATEDAVEEVVREASKPVAEPGWAILVVAGRHAPDKVLADVRARLNGIPVYGGAVVGAISRQHIGYSGHEIGLLVFDRSHGLPQARCVGPLGGREVGAGEELGRWLQQSADSQPGQPAAFLFYDVVRSDGLNHGSLLLDGIYRHLEEHAMPIFGAGMIADFQVTSGFVFDGEAVVREHALALVLPPGLEVDGRVMHGCTPVSRLLTITRATGPKLYELDGKPAAETLQDLAGGKGVALSFSVLLGRRMGDPMAPFKETEFVNRLIIDVNEDDGSVSLFETDFEAGDKVQVMFRNNDFLMDSVDAGVAAMVAEDAPPLLAMYIDCAGRASIFTGSEGEEADRLRSALGRTPLFGFYAGREIAPYGGRSRPLDWTGVLVVLKEGEQA